MMKHQKMISKSTGEVVGRIFTDRGMTLDAYIELLGGEIICNEADDRFDQDGENVIIDGKRYYYDDLEVRYYDE